MLELDHVSKSVWRGAHELPLLAEVSLEVGPGELVAVHGQRRGGKTTLLAVAAGLMTPDAGVVRFDGADLSELSTGEHTRLLAEQIGWARLDDVPLADIPMIHHVAFPLLASCGRRKAERRAAETLALVGAGRCARTTWERLSDLERALVTLARSLVREPRLLLVDDPTVGLQREERDVVLGLLREQAERAGLGVLLTTADQAAARRAHRGWTLRGGRLIASARPPDDGGRLIRFPVR